MASTSTTTTVTTTTAEAVYVDDGLEACEVYVIDSDDDSDDDCIELPLIDLTVVKSEPCLSKTPSNKKSLKRKMVVRHDGDNNIVTIEHERNGTHMTEVYESLPCSKKAKFTMVVASESDDESDVLSITERGAVLALLDKNKQKILRSCASDVYDDDDFQTAPPWKVHDVANWDPKTECVICMSDDMDSDSFGRLVESKCGHVLHFACLYDYYFDHNHKNCPTCKRPDFVHAYDLTLLSMYHFAKYNVSVSHDFADELVVLDGAPARHQMHLFACRQTSETIIADAIHHSAKPMYVRLPSGILQCHKECVLMFIFAWCKLDFKDRYDVRRQLKFYK